MVSPIREAQKLATGQRMTVYKEKRRESIAHAHKDSMTERKSTRCRICRFVFSRVRPIPCGQSSSRNTETYLQIEHNTI
ncbi:hypothetical protein GRJ2_002256400 [Grus japonensis]|uniref:Uncharacterized protein n=1 Tax=Grus japonensis TaxID=30415 RepID=A0ABC9XLK0_GRUJA